MLRNIIMIVALIITGIIYYKFSISKKEEHKNQAFIFKIIILGLSLIIAFLEQEYISIGSWSYGGRASIMIIILIEIIDAFVDRQTNKQNYKKDKH